MKLKEGNIQISINPIKANTYFITTVKASDKETSARINVPLFLKDKRVMVIVIDDGVAQGKQGKVGQDANPPP